MDASALASAEYWLSIIGIAKLVAAALVAAGVAIEFGGDWIARPFEKTIRNAQELRIAQLQKATADANAEATDAKLELEKYKAARLPSADQVELVAKKIKPFAGTKYDIGMPPMGFREVWDFEWRMEPVFAKAGWVFAEWQGGTAMSKLNWQMQPHLYGLTNVVNVSIELTPAYRDRLFPAAEALATALNEIGIAANVENHIISSSSINADAVHVLFGEKR